MSAENKMQGPSRKKKEYRPVSETKSEAYERTRRQMSIAEARKLIVEEKAREMAAVALGEEYESLAEMYRERIRQYEAYIESLKK